MFTSEAQSAGLKENPGHPKNRKKKEGVFCTGSEREKVFLMIGRFGNRNRGNYRT